MVKKRKKLTAKETRYFMIQLISAVDYMHSNRVIHRDLKLGNIFLNSNMEIKVGDFGLAAKL
jgi:serine/threonine protein kinase